MRSARFRSAAASSPSGPRNSGFFVFFVARGSPAREAGLRMGDVIVAIEGAEVANLEDFRREIAQGEQLERFLVTVRRGEDTKFLLVKPGARAAEDDEEAEAGEVDWRDRQ